MLKEFIDDLKFEYGYSKNTLSAYARDVKKFLSFLKEHNTPVAKINRSVLEQFTEYANLEKKSPRSIARLFSAVRTFLRFLAREGIVKPDVVAYVKIPRISKKLPDTLSQNQVEEILKTAEDSFSFRDRAILELLYATGARVSEVVELKLRNLNFDRGYVIFDGKGGRQRIVPIGPVALEAIKQYLQQERARSRNAGSEFLFISRKGEKLNRATIWRIVKKIARACGLDKEVWPHLLRHSFATHMLQGGAGIRYIQEFLGHSSISATQLYTHLDARRLKEIHKKYHPRG